jgi:hypothetical protein
LAGWLSANYYLKNRLERKMEKFKMKLIQFIYKLYFRKELKVDEFQFIDKYLKKKGYDEYGDTYSKGFVIVKLNLKSKEIVSIEIWIDKISKQKQEIKENFSTGLIIAENYYSRI